MPGGTVLYDWKITPQTLVIGTSFDAEYSAVMEDRFKVGKDRASYFSGFPFAATGMRKTVPITGSLSLQGRMTV